MPRAVEREQLEMPANGLILFSLAIETRIEINENTYQNNKSFGALTRRKKKGAVLRY